MRRCYDVILIIKRGFESVAVLMARNDAMFGRYRSSPHDNCPRNIGRMDL